MRQRITNRIRYIFIAGMILISLSAYTQQIPVYFMQNLVRPTVNPAYTGLDGIYDVVVLNRQQWVGFEDAPRSIFLGANVPLGSQNAGVGFDVQQQSSGPLTQSGIFMNYSYTINTSENSNLSLGLRGGFNNYRISLNELSLIDQGDILFETNVENLLLPNFGVGIHYTFKNYYADFSIPLLLRNEFSPEKQDREGMENKEDRLYNIQSGAKFKLIEGFELNSNMAIWFAKGIAPLVDIRLSAIVKDAAGFGIAYRFAGSFGAFISYKVDNFILAYAYELPLAYDYQINSGTHEIVLGFDFQLLNRKTTSPRRF